MKVLQLVNRIPFPLNDGGNLAVHAITEGFLQAGVSLSMLAMNTTRHWVDIEQLPPVYGQLQHFETVKVDNSIKPLAALINLFKGTSYNVERFISREYEQVLIKLLQQENFDIIHLEGLFLAPYIETIRKYSTAKIVMRQHNIEFSIWVRLAQQAKNPLKKAYLNLLARRLRKFELAHLNDYDLVLPISERESLAYQVIGGQKPVMPHLFGIDLENIPFAPANTEPLSLYHIGAMDWLPNQESVNWLLEKVMPVINEKLPETRLYLAGRNMPDYYFQQKWKNVEVVGEVPDAIAFEKDKSLLLVPLLSGGGVRIKIFQAMAMGKTVITTSVGMEGIDATNGVEVFVANTPEAFATAIINVIQQPEIIRRTGVAARNLMAAKHNRKTLIQDLLHRYQQLIEETQQ